MKDHSQMPKGHHREGLVPDAEPRFVQVLVEKWAAEADDDKPTALGTPFRHSDAGKCARKIAYTAAGIPKSDPMDLSGWWNTGLGTRIHELWQEAVSERWPTAEIEPKVAMVGADGSGHLDAVFEATITEANGNKIAYELKTIGGYGYKAATGTARKGTPAEGPKSEHRIQAAINGLAVNADEVIIGYLSKEAISINVAKGYGVSELERFCCEWTFTRDQYEPLAREEAARVAAILARVERGELAPRRVPGEMPKGAEVQNPATGAWTLEIISGDDLNPDDTNSRITVDTGSTWQCGYCSHQTLCLTTEPGIIPIDSVVRR